MNRLSIDRVAMRSSQGRARTVVLAVAIVLSVFGTSAVPQVSRLPVISQSPFAVEQASAAKRLGGLDLNGYCKKKYSTTNITYQSVGSARLNTHNAWGWSCLQATAMLWQTGWNPPTFTRKMNYYSHSIDTNDVCRQQYGAGAWSSYSDFNNPYSWSCYR